MQKTTCEILYSYWTSLRSDQNVPRRIDIQPTQIRTILPRTLLVEAVSSEILTIRLAGTRLCELFGQELRDQDFLAFWPASDRLLLQHQLDVSVSNATGVRICAQVWTRDSASVMSELILLPLADNRGQVTRWIGAWNIDFHQPWHSMDHITSFKLRSCKSTDEYWHPVSGVSIETASSMVPVFALPTADRLVRQRHRNFRVYDGGLSSTGSTQD